MLESSTKILASNNVIPEEHKSAGTVEKSVYRKYLEKTSVAEFYRKNHQTQSIENVQNIKQEIFPIGKFGKHDFIDIIQLIDEIYDQSDPDTHRSQIVHALQTGEACRKMYPDKDWFHLLGFIHDCGKVIAHPKIFNLPQWMVVGDTFPIGCQFSDQCVFADYFKGNPDYENEIYKTKLGIYKEGLGFENVTFSWGHDEYMYQVLKNNENYLPDAALYIVRYHSFYPWHQNGAYEYLASQKDKDYLHYLKDFQQCDLYSKLDEDVNVGKLLPYFMGLIRKYFPSTVLKW